MIPKIALFAVHGKEFALPIEGVQHIIQTPRIFPLPLLREGLRGVFIHNSEVVPLLDITHLLGLKDSGDPAHFPFTVLFFTEYGTVGLPAGQIRQIVDRATGKIEAADPAKGEGLTNRNFVHSRVRYPFLDAATMMAFLAD